VRAVADAEDGAFEAAGLGVEVGLDLARVEAGLVAQAPVVEHPGGVGLSRNAVSRSRQRCRCERGGRRLDCAGRREGGRRRDGWCGRGWCAGGAWRGLGGLAGGQRNRGQQDGGDGACHGGRL
jgi:hypothetical protein